MARRDSQSPHRRYVTRQRQLQLARREVPNLDDAVPRSRGKPLIARLDSDAAHPAQVPGDDSDELPWGVVCRFDCSRRLVERERLRKLARRRERGRLGDGGFVDGRYHARSVVGGWRDVLASVLGAG